MNPEFEQLVALQRLGARVMSHLILTVDTDGETELFTPRQAAIAVQACVLAISLTKGINPEDLAVLPDIERDADLDLNPFLAQCMDHYRGLWMEQAKMRIDNLSVGLEELSEQRAAMTAKLEHQVRGAQADLLIMELQNFKEA